MPGYIAVTKDDGKASAIREVGPQSVDAMVNFSV